jgi:hypothetical protein
MTGALKQYANEVRNNLRYGVMRWRHRKSLPVLTEHQSAIVRDLIETGVHVTTLETLCGTERDAILGAGDALQARLAEMPVQENGFTVSASCGSFRIPPSGPLGSRPRRSIDRQGLYWSPGRLPGVDGSSRHRGRPANRNTHVASRQRRQPNPENHCISE